MSHTVEAKGLEEVGYITVCKPYSVDPLVSVPWAAVLIELDRELPCPFRTLAIGPQRSYRGQGADVGASHQAFTGLADGLMLMVSHLDRPSFPLREGEGYFLRPFRPSPSSEHVPRSAA